MSLTELQRHAQLPSHLPKELTWTREHASCPVRNSFHTVPYLSRTLRPEGYGLMVYSLSIAAFLTIICDYGFSLTAMQSAAERREDVEALRRIFTAVMIAKLLIFLACLLTFGLLVAVVPQLQQHWRVHLLALLSTFGALVFPGWLFQAMQKMTQLAWVSITARGIAVVAIFLFVRNPSDVWLAILIQGVPVSGIVALFLVRRWLGARFNSPYWPEVFHQFRIGWRVFASTLAINLYSGAQTDRNTRGEARQNNNGATRSGQSKSRGFAASADARSRFAAIW